jgi:Cu/Ag efflux protein CusF
MRRAVIAAAAALLMLCSARAEETQQPAAAPVYTRAEVRSFFEEPGGKTYVRLKLLPRLKIPFSTQNFLVTDRSMLVGIQEGASVRFTAKHLAGENTLTSIQLAEPCVRFQKCE